VLLNTEEELSLLVSLPIHKKRFANKTILLVVDTVAVVVVVAAAADTYTQRLMMHA